MSRPIDALVVGIPAKDEEAGIHRCLTALIVSAVMTDVPVVIAVAADDCHDRTVEIAESTLRSARHAGFDGLVISTVHAAAGAARAAAIDAALERFRRAPERVWVATTDADTTVDPSWLPTHLAWARSGADGVAGLVDVAWPPGSRHLAERYRSSIVAGGSGVGHEHVHGANLGLRADRWMAVGGCGDDVVGEDHELWQRLRTSGSLLLGVDDLRVTTSSRLTGRAPEGFARYLRDLLDEEGVG